MLDDPNDETPAQTGTDANNIGRRIETSIARVVSVEGFSCLPENGKWILRGRVASRDDMLMCLVVARSVRGADKVVSEIKVAR